MLDISKIQTGTLIFHEESFDLDELVHEIVENIQEITPTHRIHIESVAHVQVVGDRDRVGQVLINLLTNAIKYSHQANKVIPAALASR
jgi:signal transduction histidine kinase